MSLRYHTTGANNIGIRENRRPLDPSLRYQQHGPIKGMQEPGLIARLLGVRR